MDEKLSLNFFGFFSDYSSVAIYVKISKMWRIFPFSIMVLNGYVLNGKVNKILLF